jgi:Gpi18-like mannosyltransferase
MTGTWWSKPLPLGLLLYALTSGIVVLGASFGHQFIAPPGETPRQSFHEKFSAYDGGWYKWIAANGYQYDPKQQSSTAFFPLYPLIGAGMIRLTDLDATWALLIVSHACLAAAFVVAAIYLRSRRPEPDRSTVSLTLLALGLMPATFFFRMTYSESVFLLLTLLFLLGIQRNWPLPALALIAGLTTASRPVGVGLLLPLAIYAWNRSPNRRIFFTRIALSAPLACCGLIAYAVFLYVQFGDPLVFAKTQIHWGRAAPTLTTKLVALASYQPIWEIFLWQPPAGWSVFAWEQVNPVYFAASVALIVFGAWRGRLNVYETSLAAMLLLIPYLTRGYEMNMASSARFAAVVFPVYLVLGEGLSRLPPAVSAVVLGISTFFLGAYSALFAGGYAIF